MKMFIAVLLAGFTLLICTGLVGSSTAAMRSMNSTGKSVSSDDSQCSPDLDPGCPAGWPEDLRGATRVDRDLYPFHAGDSNQFGDDEAYNSMSGRVHAGVGYPIHREDP